VKTIFIHIFSYLLYKYILFIKLCL